MVHQEDMGMHREMAKMAFRRGIWSFIQKMDLHLRQYAKHQSHFAQGVNAVSLAHKVPFALHPHHFSLLSDFWVTLAMCRCASWVIATVNSYLLQS
jgi:hypothetical protein